MKLSLGSRIVLCAATVLTLVFLYLPLVVVASDTGRVGDALAEVFPSSGNVALLGRLRGCGEWFRWMVEQMSRRLSATSQEVLAGKRVRLVEVGPRDGLQNEAKPVPVDIKVALKRLRRFARTGAADELDLDGTIKSTAERGYLDVQLRPERRNAVKLLVFFDVGGSMDSHVEQVEELFSAAKSEFKHMEYFYFHNFLYERVWKDNRRRHTEKIPTWDVMHKYGQDYKLIFVGDATMSPYEIVYPGGSVEHTNEEPGAVWLQRVLDVYPNTIWINPQNETLWDYHESIRITRQIMQNRMFPLTLEGLDRGMRFLSKKQ